MTRVERIEYTPAQIARRQRAEWGEAIGDGRRALAIDGSGEDALQALAAALDGEPQWEAVVWLEGIETTHALPEAVGTLAKAARRGLGVALVVPNTRHMDHGRFRNAIGLDEARSIAERLGGEIVATQHLAEGALLERAGEADGAPAVRIHRDLLADPEDAFAWLVAAGLPGAGADAVAASVTFAPVHRAFIGHLERANAELRRANVRLAREKLGVHDAAAAAFVARYERLQRELEATKKQLAIEIEVGRRNDEYFQAARAKLDEPQHRAAEGIYRRLARIPGVKLLTRG